MGVGKGSRRDLLTSEFWNFTIFLLLFNQARKQLGIPGGAKSFLRGAQIFLTMSNSFELCPTHFSRGGRKIF